MSENYTSAKTFSIVFSNERGALSQILPARFDGVSQPPSIGELRGADQGISVPAVGSSSQPMPAEENS